MTKRYKSHLPPFPGYGILLVDKPKEWTSHDVVNFIRVRFNVKKVGHCGTLDPAATGLLVMLVGQATKMSPRLSGQDKAYDSVLLLGTETDSQDMDGEVIAERSYDDVTEQTIRDTFAGFKGEQEQLPPMVSAKKVNGKKLYEIARQGKTIERETKTIIIHSLDIQDIDLPYVKFNVKCSKGAYIRTLCADIGAKIGCGGALYDLRRTESGAFNLADATTIDEIKTWTQDDLEAHLTHDF